MLPEKSTRYRVSFFYTLSTKQEEFWKDAGKFWSKDTEHFLGRRDGVEQAVAQVVGANDTPEQKVRKIYEFVSALENQSYIPPREEKEKKALGIKAEEGVEDVLRQRSGYHNQLNLLFAAMVRAAGIPAWMMWVPSRDQKIFETALLTTRQFNAEIVIVELGGRDVFLDPGSKFCPYGVLDWRYSNNRGLRQHEGGKTEFADSPLPDYTQAMIQRLARLQLTDEGKVEGTVKVGFYGIEAMERRQEGGKTDAEGRKKLLEDEVKGWLPADSEVHLAGMPNWEAAEQNLVAEFKIASSLATGSGKRWIVPVHIFQINDKALFPQSERIDSVYFDYPWRQLDDVHITLPASMAMESLPPSDAVRQDYAIYKVDQKQEGEHGIAARRDLTVAGIAFPVTMYKDVKGFFDKVKAGDDQQAILKTGAHAELK
jgi:transglutaminase superfamily protein